VEVEDAAKEVAADTVEAAAQEDMKAVTDQEVVEVVDTTREAVAAETVDATTAARMVTWPEIAPARPREGAATNATKLDTSPGIAPPHLRSFISSCSVQSVS